MVKLKCGCEVSEEGKFVLSEKCKGCRECTSLVELHPFGSKRFFKEY